MGSVQESNSTVRSFEYLTPEETPSTPTGYGNAVRQRPVSAPTAPAGQPSARHSKEVSVCQRTGTVIPSVPPMPSAALRHESARKLGAELPSMSPLTRQGLDSKFQDSAPRQKRPHSAAAAVNAFAASRSSSSAARRRNQEAPLKEICYPPNVLSAARHGKYTEVEDALKAGFVPNYADSYGNTIFHIACQNGRKRIAKLAIKYGCDVNAQNMKGSTGLHFLFAYGYADMAEYFINKGADESITNGVG